MDVHGAPAAVMEARLAGKKRGVDGDGEGDADAARKKRLGEGPEMEERAARRDALVSSLAKHDLALDDVHLVGMAMAYERYLRHEGRHTASSVTYEVKRRLPAAKRKHEWSKALQIKVGGYKMRDAVKPKVIRDAVERFVKHGEGSVTLLLGVLDRWNHVTRVFDDIFTFLGKQDWAEPIRNRYATEGDNLAEINAVVERFKQWTDIVLPEAPHYYTGSLFRWSHRAGPMASEMEQFLLYDRGSVDLLKAMAARWRRLETTLTGIIDEFSQEFIDAVLLKIQRAVKDEQVVAETDAIAARARALHAEFYVKYLPPELLALCEEYVLHDKGSVKQLQATAKDLGLTIYKYPQSKS